MQVRGELGRVGERVWWERAREGGLSCYKLPRSHLGFIVMMNHKMQSVSLIV